MLLHRAGASGPEWWVVVGGLPFSAYVNDTVRVSGVSWQTARTYIYWIRARLIYRVISVAMPRKEEKETSREVEK